MAEAESPRQLKNTAENISEHISDYVETFVKLSAVKATQKATEVATVSYTVIIVLIFGLIVMLFLGFALAAWLAESMSEKAGYAIVALVYSLLGLILMACRKRWIFPFIRDWIVSRIYENRVPENGHARGIPAEEVQK